MFQTELIFPTHAVAPAGPLPQGARRVQLPVGSDTLHGVHVPPSRASAAKRVLILGFAGNAWNSEAAAAYLHKLYPEADVIAFHYRGYRPSTGAPSAKALLADAPKVHDFAVNLVKPQHVIAVGFSIGSGVAASLARQRDLDGVILVTPFDSLKAVASGFYPWLPVGMIFQHEMNAARSLAASAVPVAILAGEYDTLIPRARTDGLRAAVPNLVFDRTIAAAGHNDIYERADFHVAMREALNTLRGAPPSR